jgi:hypothetical protein
VVFQLFGLTTVVAVAVLLAGLVFALVVWHRWRRGEDLRGSALQGTGQLWLLASAATALSGAAQLLNALLLMAWPPQEIGARGAGVAALAQTFGIPSSSTSLELHRLAVEHAAQGGAAAAAGVALGAGALTLLRRAGAPSAALGEVSRIIGLVAAVLATFLSLPAAVQSLIVIASGYQGTTSDTYQPIAWTVVSGAALAALFIRIVRPGTAAGQPS